MREELQDSLAGQPMQDSLANWLPSSFSSSFPSAPSSVGNSNCTSRECIPCLQFEGSKPGFVFEHAQLGTGYYLDSPDASARAGSGGDGHGQEDAHDGGGGSGGGHALRGAASALPSVFASVGASSTDQQKKRVAKFTDHCERVKAQG